MYRVNVRQHLIKSFKISFYVIVFVLCLSSLFHFAKPNEQKTKLCADSKCKDDLFPSSFVRVFDSEDQSFLKTKINAPVKVVAFRFSDRPDILEAEDAEGKRGLIFESYIDQMPYVIFLESALKKNQTFYMVDRVGDWPKVIKEIGAFPELYLMYTTYAAKLDDYVLDKDLIAQLTQYEESQKKAKAHRHNHHQNVQHQQRNNAELLNSKSDQKAVEDNTKNELKTEGNTNKLHGGTQLDESRKATEQQTTDKKEQIKNEELEIQAEKQANSDQQQRNLSKQSPEKENVVTTDQTSSEVNKQQKEDRQQNLRLDADTGKVLPQQIQSPSHNPPEPVLNSPSDSQSNQTLQQQQIPTTQSHPNQQQIPQSLNTENLKPLRQELPQPSLNPQPKPELVQNSLPKAQSEQLMQQQISLAEHSESAKISPPSPNHLQQQDSDQNLSPKNQLDQKFQQQNLLQDQQQSISIKSEPTPSVNNQPESAPIQTSQLHDHQSRSHLDLSHESVTASPQQNDLPLHFPLQNLSHQTEHQRNELADENSSKQPEQLQQDNRVQQTLPPITQQISLNQQVNEANAGEVKKQSENVLPLGDDDIHRIKVTESHNQPHERSTISGDAATDHKSIGIGTPTDEPFTPQQLEITADNKRKSAETQKDGGVFDATQNENDLQREKSTAATEQQKYCFKEDCQEFDKHLSDHNQPSQQQSLPSPIPSALNKMFREWMTSVRAVLPEPFCHFEDTGLLVLAFVITAFVLHLINLLLSSNSGPEPFNHRLLHDCITRLKEQELIIEKADKNAAINQRLGKAAELLEADPELDIMELPRLKSRLHTFEMERDQMMLDLKTAQDEKEYLTKEVEKLRHELVERDQTKLDLKTAQEEKEHLTKEMEKLRHELVERERDLEQRELDRHRLTQLCSKLVQMLEEKDPENGAGSGGSAGWSDLGDGMEIPAEADSELTDGKLVDVLELAKLKSRVHTLETEKDQMKLDLKTVQDEKEHLTKELEKLRHELVERERDSEQRELDRHGLTQQCSKLLQMVEEKDKKMDHSEQEREKLRTRLSEAELGLLRVEDEKREFQHRIKELEQSLKQITELNGRLENKFYHEERRLNNKIRQLDEQLTIAKSSLNMSTSVANADLNMSANSSDQGFIPLSSPDGGVERGRSGVPSLWSEIDISEPVEDLASLGKRDLRRRSTRSGNATGEVSRDSPFLNDIVRVNKLGREERLNNSKFSSGASVRSANVPRQRMRSRSAGRQSVLSFLASKPNVQIHKPMPR